MGNIKQYNSGTGRSAPKIYAEYDSYIITINVVRDTAGTSGIYNCRYCFRVRIHRYHSSCSAFSKNTQNLPKICLQLHRTKTIKYKLCPPLDPTNLFKVTRHNSWITWRSSPIPSADSVMDSARHTHLVNWDNRKVQVKHGGWDGYISHNWMAVYTMGRMAEWWFYNLWTFILNSWKGHKED